MHSVSGLSVDGLTMAADWQKELRWHWEQRPQEEVEEAVRKHGLKKGRPEIKVPPDLLEEKDGLGVFLNADEGKEIMTEYKGTEALDAGLLAAAQAVEHYEISRYGTLKAWALKLGMKEAAQLLDATLQEEHKTDEDLTALALDGVNAEAMAA